MHEQKPLDQKEVLSAAADALLSEPVTITVEVPGRNRRERLLQRTGLKPRRRVFYIRPLVLGSLLRISRLLLSIDKSLLTVAALEGGRFLDTNYALIREHSEQLAEIVAIAATNERREPPRRLVEFLLYHLPPQDLLAVLKVVVAQMNLSDFTASIISVRGLNVLEEKTVSATAAAMNPQIQGSPIASGVSSAG